MSIDVFSAHNNPEQAKLDPARAAVIVVDMINEFCKPGGRMVLPGYETLVGPQLSVIEAARKTGVPVIWVHDSHRRNMRRDREYLKRTPHGVEGTWATEIFCVEVIDKGTGLPTENRHRILEPYMTRRAKGTGLGLAYVK